MNESIRVCITDDSPFICNMLTKYLESESDIEVVGRAYSGKATIDMVNELSPDVLTLDLEMADMNGLSVLEKIMCDRPTPVIVISGVSREARRITHHALNNGAVDYVLKYAPGQVTVPDELRKTIIQKVRVASKVKVVRLAKHSQLKIEVPEVDPFRSIAHSSSVQPNSLDSQLVSSTNSANTVVVVGASTGGPLALTELLGNLPEGFSETIIVVQHISNNFSSILAHELSRHTQLNVKVAEQGELVEASTVYVAPGDYHIEIDASCCFSLSQEQRVKGHRPSIDLAMMSVSERFGQRTVGLLLTGMGDDGSEGLTAVRSHGGMTLAQDPSSCVVSSMPKNAINRGVVDHIAVPGHMAVILCNELNARRRSVS